NTPIATLLAEGESPSALPLPARKEPPKPPPLAAAPARPPGPAAGGAPIASAPGAGKARAVATASRQQVGRPRIFASPLARRLARAGGLDLSALSGSGPHGRIIKRDVEAAAKGRAAAAPQASKAMAALSGAGLKAPQPMAEDKILALYEKSSYELVPHDGMRKVIAQRLTL